jgi:aminoglycoside phosphotransferase (APT) family kinase protein
VDQEARLLATVAGFSPLPVPEPVFTAAGQGCLAYFKVPGVPLLDLPESHRSSHAPSIATTLGEFLTAINAAPVELMAELVGVDDAPLDEWRRDAAQLYATIAGEVPAVRRRPAESFLAAPTPAGGYPLVFSHNDLGIEHVLVDPARWTVSGIIDWSDAAIVDPAYDLGLLHRDLGPAALAAAISHYRIDAGEIGKLHERAVFYARCSVFEDLAYGIETGHGAFVDKSLAAMRWLFPA